MATLDELLDEQNVIRNELAALDDNPDTTEEDHGDLRDELIKRWKAAEKRKEPLIKRMEDLKLINKAADAPANRESGDGGGEARRMTGSRGPEFMQRKDPLADREATSDYTMLPRSEVIARASTLIEQHERRGWLPGRGEVATRAAQAPGIARHMLMYGHDEYYEAFRDYVADPTGPGLQRAAGALSLASAQGGFRMVAAA
jgi:hypothetical protein